MKRLFLSLMLLSVALFSCEIDIIEDGSPTLERVTAQVPPLSTEIKELIGSNLFLTLNKELHDRQGYLITVDSRYNSSQSPGHIYDFRVGDGNIFRSEEPVIWDQSYYNYILEATANSKHYNDDERYKDEIIEINLMRKDVLKLDEVLAVANAPKSIEFKFRHYNPLLIIEFFDKEGERISTKHSIIDLKVNGQKAMLADKIKSTDNDKYMVIVDPDIYKNIPVRLSYWSKTTTSGSSSSSVYTEFESSESALIEQPQPYLVYHIKLNLDITDHKGFLVKKVNPVSFDFK